MRVLGIDYGDKAVGLAISDEMGVVARGLPTIIRDHTKKKWAFIPLIAEIVRNNNVGTVVVGLPINKNFTMGQQGTKTLEFKEKLCNHIPGVDVVLRDERFTTAIAERILLEADVSRKRRGQVIDKMAATIILQDYLDEVKNRQTKDKTKEEIIINKDGNNMDDFNMEEFNMEDTIIHITDENGIELEFCVLDEAEHNKVRYLLVVETDIIEDDEAEAVIFKEVGTDKEDMVFEELSDEEFEVVAKLFDERLKDFDIEY